MTAGEPVRAGRVSMGGDTGGVRKRMLRQVYRRPGVHRQVGEGTRGEWLGFLPEFR